MSHNYGLTLGDLKASEYKIKKQNDFLENTYYQDNISGTIKPLRDFIVSANHNPNRYYALVQNRVNSIMKIAKERNLLPVFMTITLPSKYHKCKQDKNGNLVANPKYDGITTPKEANKLLTEQFRLLRNDRSFRKDNVSKDNRIYIRVTEPHKDGTPHAHILLFVPSESIPKIVKAFHRLFPQKTNKIETNIKNPVGYMMKYVLKLLPKSKDKQISINDKYLNAWYSCHNILRFSTSRTLIPLYVYKYIYEKYNLYEATNLYNPMEYKKDIGMKVFNVYKETPFFEIYQDMNTKKIYGISLVHFDFELGDLISDDELYKRNIDFSIINLSSGKKYA